MSVDALGNPPVVDLHHHFPQSWRLVLVRSFWFLLMVVVVIVGMLKISLLSSYFALDVTAQYLIFALTALVLVSCAAKILYESIALKMHAYTIELEHLTITQGILFRSRASFPIAKINDVSLSRTPVDWLFGLYRFDVLTASPTAYLGRIEGLSRKNAIGLQLHILDLVKTTVPKSEKAETEPEHLEEQKMRQVTL